MAGLYRIPWAERPVYVKSAIDSIGSDCGRSRLFDEVDHFCSQNLAFLYCSESGFVVLRPGVLDGRKFVEVLAAFTREPVDAIRVYGESIRRLATVIGAEYLEFWTARQGFERLAPRNGWEKAFTVWRQPL